MRKSHSRLAMSRKWLPPTSTTTIHTQWQLCECDVVTTTARATWRHHNHRGSADTILDGMFGMVLVNQPLPKQTRYRTKWLYTNSESIFTYSHWCFFKSSNISQTICRLSPTVGNSYGTAALSNYGFFDKVNREPKSRWWAYYFRSTCIYGGKEPK